MATKGERGQGGHKLGVWDQQIQTIMYKIYKQQGTIVQHGELYSTFYNKP